jgi:hypothetical protein
VTHAGDFGLEEVTYHVGEGGYDRWGLGIELAGEVEVFGFRQRDADGPGVREVVAVGGVGVETVSKFEFDFVETEGAVGMVQDLPALVRGCGGGETIAESDQLELSVEQAPEGAPEDHAEGRIKFGVPAMLDADPGAEAEEEDDGAASPATFDAPKIECLL